MLFDRLAEQKIREALREGRFDNLPGAGQPIDLEDYFKTPEDRRMAYGLLKSAGVVPEEVELLAGIDRLERTAAAEADPEVQGRLREQIENVRLRLALQMEKARRRR